MLFDARDRILFIGDSIGDYGRARPAGEFPGGLGTSYIAVIAQLLKATYPERLYRVINVSTSGNRSRDLVQRWETDVLANKPDWVCVLIGINDVWRQFDCAELSEMSVLPDEYEANMEKMISSTLPTVKGMILMTPFFMEQNREDPMRKRMDEYGAIVRKLGQKHGLLTLDLQQVWDDFFARGIHPHAITWDCIHPGDTGRMVLVRAFLKAIGYEW